MIRVVPIPTWQGGNTLKEMVGAKVEHGKFHLCQFNCAIVPLPPPTSLPYQGKLELEMVSEEEEQLVPEGKSPT